jgi:tetratricopeptide (TPR) repeat protein
VLDGMTLLGTCFYTIGAFDKAIPLFEEALKRQEHILGRADLVTLTTIGNLGANYVAVGRDADAVPLLEEVRKHLRQYPQLDFVSSALLEAYVHLGDSGKAMALAEEIIVTSRATLPEGSLELAQGLVAVGLALVELQAWTAAEPVLREVLAIREQAQPDAWTTFNTKSLLGAALLGQQQYSQAEPLLLAGYRGMKEREASIPGQAGVRIPQALERLVRLCEAQGDAARASVWREELEAARKGDRR